MNPLRILTIVVVGLAATRTSAAQFYSGWRRIPSPTGRLHCVIRAE